MPTKVQFIREVHNVNKIPIDPKEEKKRNLKHWKECKTNNKKWLWIGIWSMSNCNPKWL